MQGLPLARAFFESCLPILQEEMDIDKMAFGLAGEGSECFGFDDTLSMDHDFGASFCIWVSEQDYAEAVLHMEAVLARLPETFMGYPSRMFTHDPMHRRGLLSIERFYRHFLNLERAPLRIQEWLAIPEFQLACATNGEVFMDALGRFSEIRSELLAYYPHELWITKLAASSMQMAQSGQYNFPRSLKRGDLVSAALAKNAFCKSALSFVALINKRYLPFYKHAPRFVRNLPLLGSEVRALLESLLLQDMDYGYDFIDHIEDFCENCQHMLESSFPLKRTGSWLWDYGPMLMELVHDRDLRKCDLLHLR